MLRPLLIVASTAVLGLLAAGGIIRTLRARSYRGWPPLLRWLFLGGVGFLVALGTVGLVSHYAATWSSLAATWFLMAPLVYGLWRGWPDRLKS